MTRHNRLPSTLLMMLAFLLSGYAALTWQMSWVRQLVSLFGVTWFAITTILTVFMAGIALGSLVAGRMVDQGRLAPLLVFAGLELFLAGYGLAFRSILDLLEGVYLGIAGSADLSVATHAVLRFLFGALILVPPTLASGATLPAAAKAFIDKDAAIGSGLAGLYGANVAGAAAGAFATTFFTIGLLGYPGTALIGASANVLAAVFAVLALRMGLDSVPQPTPKERIIWTPAAKAVAATYFVVGFGSLSGEILWSRVFSQLGFNPATYTFGLVLVAFLIGHGLGSGLVFPFLIKRAAPRLLFAVIPVAIGAVTVLSVFGLIPRSSAMEPLLLLKYIGIVLPIERAWLLIPGVMVPAMLSGALFPLAARLSIKGVGGLGTGLGSLAALSTAGGIAGAFFTGFWLMPAFGAVHCLFLLAGMNAIAGLWAWRALADGPDRTRLARGGTVATALGVLVLLLAVPNHVSLVLFPGETLLAFQEGRNSSTAVAQHPEWGNFLLVHGERVKGGGTSMTLAAALSPHARSAAIIGLGTGSVVHEALGLDQLDEVTAIDIDGDLPEFIPWMRGEGMDLFVPPRFRFVENDGRHFLLTTTERFDIIANDAAIYAWYLELSTQEFNQLARDHLEPEGIYAGRLHTFRITNDAFRRELATFISVFPNAALWGLSDDIGMLVGRNGELPVDKGLSDAIGIPAALWYDAEELAEVAAGAPIITDAYPLHIPHTFLTRDLYPVLEYTSPDALPEEVHRGSAGVRGEGSPGQPKAEGSRPGRETGTAKGAEQVGGRGQQGTRSSPPRSSADAPGGRQGSPPPAQAPTPPVADDR